MTQKNTKPNKKKILQEIIEEIKTYYPNFTTQQEEKIKKAYVFANRVHKDQVRASGTPYIIHPLRATQILLSIKPDIDTVCACILHDVIGNTETPVEEIEKQFGPDIRFLCEGVEKVTQVRLPKNENQSKYIRFQKLFVAVAQDIRIIFIKLADRIHNLRTLSYLPPEKWARILHESLEVYAPVADRLGLFEFKTLIQDYCLKIQNPEIAQQIEEEISLLKKEKHSFFDNAQIEIAHVLKESSFEIINLSGREKSLRSVYEKMKKKDLTSALELYDILGFRILVKNKEECYQVLGILHSHFNPMPNRFKDYIAVPKANGYQSIHTTLLGIANSHFPIEIQIRTESMHADSEHGPAAHWAYKELLNSNFDDDYIKKTQWISQEIEAEKKHNPEAFFKEISKNILEEQIYVFTRSGEMKILPHNATPVDFAYGIHSDIGDSCVGAYINKNIKPLDYKLKQGDIVEILTKKGRKPNTAWLDFVQTGTAKSRIKYHINTAKKQTEEENINKDKEKERKPIVPKPIAKKKFMASSIKPKIEKKYSLIIGGEKNISYRFARCCHPHPGKALVAYHSRGLGSIIHEANCKDAENLDPERFQEAYFIIQKKIEIISKDRLRLMPDISSAISDRHVFMWDNSFKRKPNNMVLIKCTINVVTEGDFIDLIQDIQNLHGIVSAKEVKPKEPKD